MTSFKKDSGSTMWGAILTVFQLTSGVLTIPIGTEGSSSLSVFAPKIAEFKLNLHHMLEGSRIRKKRQAEYFDEPLEQKIRFGSSIPEDLPYLSEYNLTFWIPVHHQSYNQVLIGTEQGFLILFQLHDVSDKSAIAIAESEKQDKVSKAKAFSYYNEQWFVVLQSYGDKNWIRLFQRIGRGLETRQTITLDGESDFDLVTIKGVHYLAVATYRSLTSQGISYQATVAIYHWTQTQFDVIASRVSYGARSIACWALDGSLYLAVGQEINDDGNYAIGSPIYIYNSKEENSLVLLEVLATFGPTKVVHFYVSGSYYVIFIGQKDAVIYWWSSDQFLLWQTIRGTAYASDVSVLPLLNGEVAIAIALKEEIWFLTLDDSGYYLISFTMRLTGSTLASMQFMFSGKAYYALMLFAASYQYRPQPIWKLTVEPYYLPTAQSLDGLRQCMKDVGELINQRQDELDMVNIDYNRIWLKSKNQNVTTNVIVTGEVMSPVVVDVSQVLIATDRTTFFESSALFIRNALLTLKDIINNVQKELEGVVYNSVWQYIEGSKNFSRGIITPSLNMQTSNIDVSINGFSISRLAQSALKKTGDQIFTDSAMVDYISTGSVNVGVINGMTTDDFLLLHGDQIITGRLRFLDVEGSGVSAGAINSIPVDHLVTTKSEQKIDDLKTFSHLTSHVIDVKGQTNGEYLSDIKDKIALVDDNQVIRGLLNMAADVNVRGDIFTTGLINGDIDLSIMATQSVTKHTQQDLTGLKYFMANVFINGDLQVVGFINSFDITHLLTLSTHQIMFADLIFSGPLVINNDLLLDTVNGIDLSEEAVLKYAPYQFITDLKHFRSNIETDFVDMTEYATLDGVDPSLLVQSIVKHREGVVQNDSTVFHNALVKGKLTASGGVNGHKISDLPETVWLKSWPQIINITAVANRLTIKNDLEAKLVNNLNLETDILHVFKDEHVNSRKVFQHRIMVSKHVHTSRGLINGVDVTSFKTKLEEYKDGRNVLGTKMLNNLEIYGDLSIGGLNDLPDFSGFMLARAPQVVLGDVEFSSELISVTGSLTSNAVSFGTFNDFDIAEYLKNAVTIHSTSRPIENKYFLELQAAHLFVPSESRLNGVSLEEMEYRVVTLNTPQMITAPKTFLSELRFLKPITIADMNGIEVSDFVHRVVLVDETNHIILKQMLGTVHTSDVFVQGAINGINIKELANNAFYKSEDNNVPFFTFNNDIDVGAIATPSLDGIQWNDLIFTGADEVLGPGFFLSDIIITSNLFITGRLNGCDLSELQRHALYSNKTQQVINTEMKVLTIKVIGNVKVKNTLNQITDADIQRFISLSKDEVISSNVQVSSGVSVRHLYLTQAIDEGSLDFIMEDAVRHSIPQVVRGSKEFSDELRINFMTGGDLFVYGKLNNVDLEELDKNAVWKDGGYQMIEGDKILSSFTTDTAIVESYLNGLLLPHDVVMTDTSEHITSPVILMSDVFLDSNIMVHGRIDGVDLDSFLYYRITLTGEQNATSSLYFSKDIEIGRLNVRGTVNDLVLDLILNLKRPLPIDGYKAFLDLKVFGSFSAFTVNGYNVPLLERDVLRYNKEEFLAGVQIFQPSLQARDLLAFWINGVSLHLLSSTFSTITNDLKTTLNYLEDSTSNLQWQLGRQLTAAGNRISELSYFILVQELDLGPTTRILHAYSIDHKSKEFSHSMVMWTVQRHCAYRERCCEMEFTYWLKVTKSGNVMIDGDAESGRYYPILNPEAVTYDGDFFIWTNATKIQPKWCGDKSYETIFLTSGEFKGNEGIFNIIRNSPLVSEVKSFRHGHLYTVIAFYYDMESGDYRSAAVYIYNDARYEWTEHQILPSYGVLSMDIIGYNKDGENEILLILGTGMGTRPSSYSSVYKWNNYEREFEVFQNIPSQYVTSALWIQMGSSLMLAMAGVDKWPNEIESCLDLVSGGEINIFLYEKNMKWIQSIPAEGVVSMVSFSVEDETFLVAASAQLQNILIYKWRGYSGFVLTQSIFAADVRHLNLYKIEDEIYMTVASISGSSKILKVALQGKYSTVSKFNKEIEHEQRDEIPKDQKIIKGC